MMRLLRIELGAGTEEPRYASQSYRNYMGVLYSVYPLDGDVIEWIDSLGVLRQDDGLGKYPSLAEVGAALSEVKNLTLEKNEGAGLVQFIATQGADPESAPWTVLNLKHEDGFVTSIGFEKGWPELIVEMLIPIAARTGQLVLIPDTGDDPVVIMRGDSLAQVRARWEFLHGSS